MIGWLYTERYDNTYSKKHFRIIISNSKDECTIAHLTDLSKFVSVSADIFKKSGPMIVLCGK